VTTILAPYHLDEQLLDMDIPRPADQVIEMRLPDAGSSGTWERMAALYDRVADAVAAEVREGDRPTVISGDCTTSFGTLAGLQRAGLDPVIVWFDAHGDVNTLESSPSGYLGGMPLRMIVGYRRDLIADRLGLRDVPEERVVLVDARDLDPGEADYLADSAITRLAVDELSADRIPDGPIYLHIDFDVVAGLPGALYPAPGGPARDEVAEAVRQVIATGRVAAIGAACTWQRGHGAAEHVAPILG
jgi:arginase